MVDRHEIRAGLERALDLQFRQGGQDRREDVASTQHGLADGHEVRDRVVSITDELWEPR